MKDMRNPFTASVEMWNSAIDLGCSHCISRFLHSSKDRVRSIILDPQQRAAWCIGTLMTIDPLIDQDTEVMRLREFVRGHTIDVMFRCIQCGRICEVQLELRISPPLELTTFYALGIDDLWETRLYAIADMLHPEPFKTIR